jgi:Ca2+-binding EF-hand superfamily protein
MFAIHNLKNKKEEDRKKEKARQEAEAREAEALENIVKKSFQMADYDEDGFISGLDFKNMMMDLATSNQYDIPSEKECHLAFFAIGNP